MSFGPLEFEVGDVVEWRTPSGAIMRPCRTPLGPSEKTAQEGIQSLQDISFLVFSHFGQWYLDIFRLFFGGTISSFSGEMCIKSPSLVWSCSFYHFSRCTQATQGFKLFLLNNFLRGGFPMALLSSQGGFVSSRDSSVCVWTQWFLWYWGSSFLCYNIYPQTNPTIIPWL